MGAWGESIFADDQAQDVYHHYRRVYNQGKDHADVRQELERAWADSIEDSAIRWHSSDCSWGSPIPF